MKAGQTKQAGKTKAGGKAKAKAASTSKGKITDVYFIGHGQNSVQLNVWLNKTDSFYAGGDTPANEFFKLAVQAFTAMWAASKVEITHDLDPAGSGDQIILKLDII